MPWMRRCANCGREFPIYRLAAVLLDGEISSMCPGCMQSEHDRIQIPYAPQAPGAAQTSTSRTSW